MNDTERQQWADPTPRRLVKRLREIEREIVAGADRDEMMLAIMIEGFETLESYARFTVAQNVRIFEAIMQLAESTGTQEQIDALTARLLAAGAKFDTATGD